MYESLLCSGFTLGVLISYLVWALLISCDNYLGHYVSAKFAYGQFHCNLFVVYLHFYVRVTL